MFQVNQSNVIIRQPVQNVFNFLIKIIQGNLVTKVCEGCASDGDCLNASYPTCNLINNLLYLKARKHQLILILGNASPV